MIEVRAKKTTRHKDDYKVLIVGVVCAIFILMGSIILPRFEEQRWYRDLVRLTPFHHVELLYSKVSHDQISIQVGGSLVKRRCDFNNLFGYVYANNGLRYRLPVDTSNEPVHGNRPPSDVSESWGPWKLNLDDNPNIPTLAIPTRWEIVAEHIHCPTVPVTQRNLFISGAWADYTIVVLEEIPLEIIIPEGDDK